MLVQCIRSQWKGVKQGQYACAGANGVRLEGAACALDVAAAAVLQREAAVHQATAQIEDDVGVLDALRCIVRGAVRDGLAHVGPPVYRCLPE